MSRTVYITQRLDTWNLPDLRQLFREIMFSVAPAYSNITKYVKLREHFKNCKIAYDSGGFSFITGKLKNPDPRKTILVYRLMGFKPGDFLIQLDLPPKPQMSKNERLKLIEKSAKYFHIMRAELGDSVLPVVHGWSREEILESLKLLENPEKLCIGTFLSKIYAHNYLQKVAIGTYNVQTVLFKVSRNQILERLVQALNLLRERKIFALGAGNPNTIHLMFLIGATYTDGATWRLAAKMHCIFIPHDGRFSIGRKNVNKPLKDINLLKKWWKNSPFNYMSFSQFWKTMRLENRRGFALRALWNAWVLKEEEKIARQYAYDPEGYHKYLAKRWANLGYWRKALEYVWRRLKQPYIQPKLTVFLKQKIEVGK